MTEFKMPRVMWLLNHGSARKFEIPMLHKIGIKEIFLPKRYPNDPNFRSASIDYSEDKNLTIPKEDLDILNSVDWYNGASSKAWEIANRHFDVIFFIILNGDIVKSIKKHFRGIALWRTYGIAGKVTYTSIITEFAEFSHCLSLLSSMGKRFFFAEAYNHLHKIEGDLLRRRRVFLPLGLPSASNTVSDQWTGEKKNVFFVCPDIKANPAYEEIYREFTENFGDFPYIVGGTQSIAVPDRRVLGYVSREEHENNMRQIRVMFYHSREPNHIHFHPFEAILAGMPVVFMGGGMLDRMGGKKLPGRCESIKEARRKIQRILDGDEKLISSIRRTQTCLLEAMKSENCEQAWRDGFEGIFQALAEIRNNCLQNRRPRVHRIAVLSTTHLRTDERAALQLVKAIKLGAQRAAADVQIVFGYIENRSGTVEKVFSELSEDIAQRSYRWKTLSPDEAMRAMAYAGDRRHLSYSTYEIPDDGINQFIDCDVWVISSDRLAKPLLPVRPYILVTDDYAQRYTPSYSPEQNYRYVSFARSADLVIASSRFAMQNAIQFAGVAAKRVKLIPTHAIALESPIIRLNRETIQPYFIWTISTSLNENHEHSLRALSIYYELYDGKLECRLIGLDRKEILQDNREFAAKFREIWNANPALRPKLSFQGKLSRPAFMKQLAGASFFWQPFHINSDISEIMDASDCGVPILANDYPALRELQQDLRIDIEFLTSQNINTIATRLKEMERSSANSRKIEPESAETKTRYLEQSADACWRAIEKYL